MILALSRSARTARIEIRLRKNHLCGIPQSRSARTARIEIAKLHVLASPAATSRGPQGPRGLKYIGIVAIGGDIKSRSARTARIEI